MSQFKILCIFSMLFLSMNGWAQEQQAVEMGQNMQINEPDHEVHQELRTVIYTMTEAINSGQYDDMLPVLSDNIRATPVNQEFIGSKQEVSAYFKKWFGTDGFLKKLNIQLRADALTELSADKTWGIVYGSGVESYILSDTRTYDIKTRWTATVVKEADGKWRIRTIHIGTNFLENPILDEATSALKTGLISATCAGLFAGVLITWLLMRRRKKEG